MAGGNAVGRHALQGLLGAIGAVATLSGLASVLIGTDFVIGADAASSNVDSELRFHAAWYAVAGVLLLRAMPSVETQATIVRAVGAGFLLAGTGRLMGILGGETPNVFFVILMIIEFVIPLVIVPWQAFVARRLDHVVPCRR